MEPGAGAGVYSVEGSVVGAGAPTSVQASGAGFLQDCIAGAQVFFAGARVSNNVCNGSVGSTDRVREARAAAWVDEDDFRQVLAMAEPLFEHALHILSMLQATEITRRTLSEQDKLFADLPDEFTTHEAQLLATERGLNAGTVASWLSRWAKRGLVATTGARGCYSKKRAIASDARAGDDGSKPSGI